MISKTSCLGAAALLLLMAPSCTDKADLKKAPQKPPTTEPAVANDSSAASRLDRGEAINSLAVTVFPFTDSDGRLYAIDAQGKVTPIEGVNATDEAPATPLSPVEQAELALLLDSDVHIVGSVLPALAGIEVWAQAADPRDANAFANASFLFPEGPPLKKVEADAGMAVPLVPLSGQAMVLAFRAKGFRQLEFGIGPRGGWTEVFKRALGQGGTPTSTPKAYAPFDGFPPPGLGGVGRTNDAADGGDDPRDTGPPQMYGEEIPGRICNVKIQCRWATGITYAAPASQVLSLRNRHCGFFSYIPNAPIKRLGVHIQPGTAGSMSGGTFLNGHVEALEFQGDRGFQEIAWAYNYDPYSKQGEDQCAIAACIRKNAWIYRLNDARPYAALGNRLSNSNSFVGAIREACLPTATPPPLFDDESQYSGIHYWRRVGRDWKTNKQ